MYQKNSSHSSNDPCFHPISWEPKNYEMDILNNPFDITPPSIAIEAAKKLQHFLNKHPWKHNFGKSGTYAQGALGKMFGVLVVQDCAGKLGYLRAFSGKIDDSNNEDGFVPPVFNILETNGFFKRGEEELNQLNAKINGLENNSALKMLRQSIKSLQLEYDHERLRLNAIHSENKKIRDMKRSNNLTPEDVRLLENESKRDHFEKKDFKRKFKEEFSSLEKQLDTFLSPIRDLKGLRQKKSAQLQNDIFKSFSFYNAKGEQRSLLELFEELPPAGAGECCGPRLFQYAYLNDYKPIAIAEFWWGQSPPKEIRNHKHFYPACRSKCFPILNFMLEGLAFENNALYEIRVELKPKVIFDDEHILIIEKPSGLLSVPGKTKLNSVYQWAKSNYPDMEGPIIIHRLDMATSGLMILAKNTSAYHHIQKQFSDRKIKKRYVAVLDGMLEIDNGSINLPLRVDLEDRPRQLVCYEHGKHAKTNYEVVEYSKGRTRVFFYPITGRTHQLRVHAAHANGLGMPIVGDDLYGSPEQRLNLHADQITFEHPKTLALMTFHSTPEF